MKYKVKRGKFKFRAYILEKHSLHIHVESKYTISYQKATSFSLLQNYCFCSIAAYLFKDHVQSLKWNLICLFTILRRTLFPKKKSRKNSIFEILKMESLSNVVRVHFPGYLRDLPVPKTVGGWFSLGLGDWARLVSKSFMNVLTNKCVNTDDICKSRAITYRSANMLYNIVTESFKKGLFYFRGTFGTEM